MKKTKFQSDYDRGRAIAELLRGSWRVTQTVSLREETSAPDRRSQTQQPDTQWQSNETQTNSLRSTLRHIVDRLCESGAAALAWRQIRDTPLAVTPEGERLHNAYRQFRLSSLIHEREIEQVVSALGSVNIRPVLIKGWAVARLYPDRALRPYGDIDLVVRPDEFGKAERVLSELSTASLPLAPSQREREPGMRNHVDLHSGFDHIGKGQWHGQWHGRLARVGVADSGIESNARTHGQDAHATYQNETVMLNSTPVRVLRAEDHLRLLCQHLFRSGALRPQWLVDVALIVETRAPDFDWQRCLGSDPVHANWVTCAIGLAQQLLGAACEAPRAKGVEHGAMSSESDGFAPGALPFALSPLPSAAQFAIRNSQFEIPNWLAPAVLRQWGRPRDHYAQQIAPLSKSNSFAGLYGRWNNPVRATAQLGARFNSWPRLPYLVGETVLRLVGSSNQ
jgi:hypothetical protein